MARWTNCSGVTRRDCLRLGLSAVFGGGLAHALRVTARAASPARPTRSPQTERMPLTELMPAGPQSVRPAGEPRWMR